ncbi:MAG: hypothetical protein LBK68_04775 [Candidatus Margulisbacteria bacterium]|jgi:hypothetical protein|nr:hypothetical protein [Candidatus Margulisiibacteriota bacterium]
MYLLTKHISITWKNWKEVSENDIQAALQRIRRECDFSTSVRDRHLAKLINEGKISLNLHIHPTTEKRLGVKFLRNQKDSITRLPILLDVNDYKISSFLELLYITKKYAVNLPVNSLPQDIEDILRTIKYSGLEKEKYSDCLSFINDKIPKIVLTRSLLVREERNFDVYEIMDGFHGGRRKFLDTYGYIMIDSNIFTYNDDGLTLKERILLSKISFAETLVHEIAHNQIDLFRKNICIRIEQTESECYALLMSAHILKTMYHVIGDYPKVQAWIKKEIVDILKYIKSIKLKDINGLSHIDKLRHLECINKYINKLKYTKFSNISFYDLTVFDLSVNSYRELYYDFNLNFDEIEESFLEKYIFNDR